jgi:alpha-mannosidase
MFRNSFQEPGLALVKSHLDMCRRDPAYRFVLAELDYLKPYWDIYPEDRAYLRQLLADGRLELMGGTYNEPNTNLTSAESTIRNAIYGVGYQRDVLGASPQTAWQLDAFGHDPQFPGIMADAGISSSSWARGPFHEWGPNWVRGPGRMPQTWTQLAEPTGMQFPSEFEWIAPSGKSLLTCFMANHYSAGWWMDAAPTLEQATREVFGLFLDLASVSATRNVLLPVGTDYSPPNKWQTAIEREWNRRYLWPRFQSAIPREFFDAVRAEQASRGRRFSPQTRDMNPIYTGKDVSFIDTKQAQRVAENTLLAAEKFATVAGLLGARYPGEAIDKAWRQLLFGAHHDGITGSESDQVYLDLLGGWREATELSRQVLDGALAHIGSRVDTSGAGSAVTVFNPLSWSRTDVVRVRLVVDEPGVRGFELRDDSGQPVPLVVDGVDRRDDGSLAAVVLTFIAREVPALGYRTWRAIPAPGFPDGSTWTGVAGSTIENDSYRIEVAAGRGGAITSLLETRSGKQLLRDGELGNELRAYAEYPNHPLYGEGPWHLTPDGTFVSAGASSAHVVAERSPIGRRFRVTGPFAGCEREQQITLWDGIERVEFTTVIDQFAGRDTLFRVRFGAQVEGATSVSEVGNAVVGRPFGFPNADVAHQPFTLDHPAYDWFALSTTARIELTDAGSSDASRAARAMSVAEVIGIDSAASDDVVRELMVALVRRGVTATLGTSEGSRYGSLVGDSNLPDIRFVLGGPASNRYADRLLSVVDPGYRTELDRQLGVHGRARLWVPAQRPLSETWRPDADLRDVRALPTLIVAGADDAATLAAVEELVHDLGTAGVVRVEQPAALDGTTGSVEPYTVAIMNRGTPGFSIEPDGSLYLSLMRACSGWPSGVWIDPPRRTLPDGSNFQFQHWSHRFEYALVARQGDWRDAGAVRSGHEYNNPLVARLLPAHAGDLPASAALVRVDPPTAVLTALKPAGHPLARNAAGEQDPKQGVALRIYESTGSPARVSVEGLVALHAAFATNALEEERRPLSGEGGSVELQLGPFEIATLHATPGALGTGDSGSSAGPEIGPRAEPAQPVYSDYWLHNKGPAPMGYLPVAVQIKPGRLSGSGPFPLPITVASSRTDARAEGAVTIAAPAGWTVEPAERPYRLAPGAHVEFEPVVTPAPGAPAGRYFVAARILDDAGQTVEDVVTIDLDPGSTTAAAPGRSPQLELARGRTALRQAQILGETWDDSGGSGLDPAAPPGGELQVDLTTPLVRVRAGERGAVRVTIRNLAASEVRGEAQLISPHETWTSFGPWTQGFAVGPGGHQEVVFTLNPPFDALPGTWWGLVKVMYFGRLWYTEAAVVEVTPAVAAVITQAAAALDGSGA